VISAAATTAKTTTLIASTVTKTKFKILVKLQQQHQL
jgi:hypothetical protein